MQVERFQNPRELDGLLCAGDLSLVYSEVACDHRLSRAGVTPFALDVLEMGPAGAVRSLQRMLQRARWPFFKRYGAYLRPRPELAPVLDPDG